MMETNAAYRSQGQLMFVFLIIYFELIFLLCFKLAACKRPKNDEHSLLANPPVTPQLAAPGSAFRAAAPRHVLG